MRLDMGVSGDKVAAVLPNDGNWQQTGTMRGYAFDPHGNRWSQMAPSVDDNSYVPQLICGIESVGCYISRSLAETARAGTETRRVERSRQDFDATTPIPASGRNWRTFRFRNCRTFCFNPLPASRRG